MKDYSNNPTARREGLVIQEMPDEVLVYDIDTNTAHCLNRSAAIVWSACNGRNSVADIARQFESSGHGTVNEDFVWLAIDQLSNSDLLETRLEQRFSGRSRRTVLKTIGVATVVALPIVASLVAPSSAMASVSCGCVAPGDCATATGCLSMSTCNGSGVCAP